MNKYPSIGKLIMAVFIVMITLPSFAQFYSGSQLDFGKNRVQFTDQFWTFYRFPKYETYFYKGGQELAIYTARYAKEQIPIIEKKLDYNLENRIQFVIFNKLSDLKQSNIGHVSDEQYNVGGVTHIVGTKVFLYFTGDHKELEKQIRSGIANVLLNQMMYGSSITSMIKNSTLLSLPDWYIQGLVSYLSDDWSTRIDNRVKDGVLSGRYEKFNQLTGEEAVFAGHSIWRFISEKYGENMIPNIVYMTKLSRNVESGFLFVLGVSFKNLVWEWIHFYDKKFYEDNTFRTYPEEGDILEKYKKQRVYRQLKISPDGTKAIYSSNELGRNLVWLHDLQTGKKKKIFRFGYKLDEKNDFSTPLLTWHPSGKIFSMILEYKGEMYLNFYTLDDKKWKKTKLIGFDKVVDMSYDHRGQKLALSAVINGQSDIFVYDLAARTFENITKDIYDDRYPAFIRNSSRIIFSSNRPGDTIVFDILTNKYKVDTVWPGESFDLFMYDYAGKDPILRRVTETPLVNETHAVEYEPGYFCFISDETGIHNRYLARLDSAVAYIDTVTHYRFFTEIKPMTDYSRGIQEQDIPHGGDKIGEIVFYEGIYRMMMFERPFAVEAKEAKPENTPYMRYLILESQKVADTTSVEEGKTPKPKQSFKTLTTIRLKGDTTKVDINNYTFESGGKKKDLGEASLSDSTFVLTKKRNYNVEYSLDQLVNQVDFSFLNTTYQAFTGGGSPIFINPGFNAFFKVGVNDLLEDYRITGGVRLTVSLDNNEYFLSFENLKKRLDKQIILHRKSMQDVQDYSIIKVHSHEVLYRLRWPFDPVISLRGTFSYRNDRSVYLSTDENNLQEPNRMKHWGGAKMELVFDNTRPKGLNLYYGTRFKVFGEYYQLIEKEHNNLIVAGLDYRYYQKIHKTFIWANRFAASSSFGNNKLIYYMGGVDTWLFPKFDSDIDVPQDQNYAYQTLATNMRGFQQNIRNGNAFFVINSELRMPVFRYFLNRPLKSDFFHNFQVVAFGDLGTAWTGLNPYSEENSLYTQTVSQGPITVTIKNQKEPIVGGFGFGVRSRILGYFLRADWAWGVENGVVKPNIFYLSLSLDF